VHRMSPEVGVAPSAAAMACRDQMRACS
jgi:hypothetical protein